VSGTRTPIEERIRAAIVRGLAWVAFEPNNEALWTRVREVATNLVTAYWRDGELVGSTSDEAFFVRCGRDTMTQQELDSGRLVILVGIAPVAPAEFVVIRIEQMTGGQRRHCVLRRWLTSIRGESA
jgi:Bacteriophage tail sheath protein